MRIHLVLALCATLAARSAGAANLVANGDFDTDTSSWFGNASFDAALDEGGDPASGSLLVTNVNAGTGAEADQRVAVTPGTTLVASFRVRLASGQSGTGYAYPGINFFTGGCTGTYLSSVNAELVDEPFDAWVTSSMAETVVPPTADCVNVVLFVRNEGPGTFAASFDAIFVPEPGAASGALAAAIAVASRRRATRRAAGRAAGASRPS
jgi:hypothetical protein